MGKKPTVSLTYENERISIKNSLPYLKCVLRLSCVVHGPNYGRFMDFYANGFLSKPLYREKTRNALLDLYFKIILPSVLYGLVVWGGYPNAELLHSLEVLHRRAAKIIYNLPRDMPKAEVYRHSNWNTLTLHYKLRLIKLLHSVFTGEARTAHSYLTNKPCTAYNLRRSNNIIVPRFKSQFLKTSISYRGAILWNAVSSHFTDQFTVFYRKVKKDSYFKELDFSAQSVQSLPRPTKILNAFNYSLFT